MEMEDPRGAGRGAQQAGWDHYQAVRIGEGGA